MLRRCVTVYAIVLRRHALGRLRVVVDDCLVQSHTQVGRVNGVVVWESVVPDLGIELRSAYTGGRGAEARVEHLVLAPEFGDIEASEQQRESPQLPSDLRYTRLSHLLRLQELLRQRGHRARISQVGRFERLLGRFGRSHAAN